MPTILVVDDSDVDRRLTGGLLSRDGSFDVKYARDGSEALNILRGAKPDLVLTDLHMPNRGGLMLIEACRIHHEDLPVVMMTGQGSEDMAVEALKAGAAGYVSKAELAQRLVETINDVLRRAQEDLTARRLIRKLVESEFQFELENDPELIPPLVEMIEQLLSGLGLCDSVRRMRVGSAVREAVNVAMVCGNLEMPPESLQSGDADAAQDHAIGIACRRVEPPYENRKVELHMRFSTRQAEISIRHQGPAFWPDQPLVPNNESLSDPRHRVLVLLQSFVDEVQYSSDGCGVTLLVNKKTRE